MRLEANDRRRLRPGRHHSADEPRERDEPESPAHHDSESRASSVALSPTSLASKFMLSSSE